MNIRDLQEKIHEWRKFNFPNADGTQQLLGLIEELGELSHAHLKGIQQIRHSAKEITYMKVDAVADLFIFLTGYCSYEGIDLEAAVLVTWEKVKQRDWIADPMNAGEGSEP